MQLICWVGVHVMNLGPDLRLMRHYLSRCLDLIHLTWPAEIPELLKFKNTSSPWIFKVWKALPKDIRIKKQAMQMLVIHKASSFCHCLTQFYVFRNSPGKPNWWKTWQTCSSVESQFWTLYEVRTKQHGINRKHRFWMTKRKAYQRNQKEDRKLGHSTMSGEIEKNVQYCIGRTHVKYQANTIRATCSPKAEWTSCSWPLPHGGIKQHQYQTAWFICTNIWFGNSWCTSYTDMHRPCCVIFSCPDCLGRNKPTRCLRRGPFNTWSHSRPV
jgi:hypothetical protein